MSVAFQERQSERLNFLPSLLSFVHSAVPHAPSLFQEQSMS